MAHYVTHHCPDLAVYGGFIRDYVFHALPPRDLDISVCGRQHLQPTMDLLTKWAVTQGFFLLHTNSKGPNVLRGTFCRFEYCDADDCVNQKPCEDHHADSFEEKWVVELVDVSFWEAKRPLVDCDMNNYLLVPTGLVHKRPGQGGPLRRIVDRTSQKRFEVLDVGPQQVERIQRFMADGWSCSNSQRFL